MTGSEFARRTAGLSGPERQALAREELSAGNVPDFLRELKPVRLTSGAAGKPLAGTVWVMPDYLAIGSDEDFLRIPLTYPSAIAVAKKFGAILPTRKIVDAVYRQADCKLKPYPMRPGPMMRSAEYYLAHQQQIESQRKSAGCAPDALVAGQKKDVVITNRLLRGGSKKIAIYGWHRAASEPIQPLSTVHGARYADYSHGIRLISPDLEVEGQDVSIFEIAQDPARASLISREGVLASLRRLIGLE